MIFWLIWNALHNQVPKNSSRWRSEHTSRNFAVFLDNLRIFEKSTYYGIFHYKMSGKRNFWVRKISFCMLSSTAAFCVLSRKITFCALNDKIASSGEIKLCVLDGKIVLYVPNRILRTNVRGKIVFYALILLSGKIVFCAFEWTKNRVMRNWVAKSRFLH